MELGSIVRRGAQGNVSPKVCHRPRGAGGDGVSFAMAIEYGERGLCSKASRQIQGSDCESRHRPCRRADCNGRENVGLGLDASDTGQPSYIGHGEPVGAEGWRAPSSPHVKTGSWKADCTTWSSISNKRFQLWSLHILRVVSGVGGGRRGTDTSRRFASSGLRQSVVHRAEGIRQSSRQRTWGS